MVLNKKGWPSRESSWKIFLNYYFIRIFRSLDFFNLPLTWDLDRNKSKLTNSKPQILLINLEMKLVWLFDFIFLYSSWWIMTLENCKLGVSKNYLKRHLFAFSKSFSSSNLSFGLFIDAWPSKSFSQYNNIQKEWET